MSESAFDGLNEKQQQFVLAFTDLSDGSTTFGHITNSAKAAKYSEKTAHVQGSALMKLPKIQAAIQERKELQQEELRNKFIKGAEIGFKTLVAVMYDPEAPAAAKVQAAKDLLDRAGFKPVEKVESKVENDGVLTITFARDAE